MKNNIVCLKHPKYEGGHDPDLSCRTCCIIFMGRVKAEQEERKAKHELRKAERGKAK